MSWETRRREAIRQAKADNDRKIRRKQAKKKQAALDKAWRDNRRK